MRHEVMVSPMPERLLYRCHVVDTQGTSYRIREYKSRSKDSEKVRDVEEERIFQRTGLTAPRSSEAKDSLHRDSGDIHKRHSRLTLTAGSPWIEWTTA